MGNPQTDLPFAGDWQVEGPRGRDSVGFHRDNGANAEFHLLIGGGEQTFTFGSSGGVPVVGDWNGDGIDDDATFPDTDGDGLTHYDEFLFGTDPTIPTGSNVIDFSPDGTTLTITLPASAGTGYTGVTRTYILQSSTDLSSWTDETQGTATGSAINYSLPAITTRKFYRVIVNVQ